MRSKKNNICGFIRIWFVAEFNAILFNTVCPRRSNIESAVIWNSSFKINEKRNPLKPNRPNPTLLRTPSTPPDHIRRGYFTPVFQFTWHDLVPPSAPFLPHSTHTHTHIIQTRPSNPLHSFTLLESWECSYLRFFFSSALILARHLKVEKKQAQEPEVRGNCGVGKILICPERWFSDWIAILVLSGGRYHSTLLQLTFFFCNSFLPKW